MSDQTEQAEDDVKAISTLLAVLKPLDPETRLHVLDFVFKRLGISFPSASRSPASIVVSPPLPSTDALSHASPARSTQASPGTIDIRSFAEQKRPTTVNAKVAVVAYYLAHLAPAQERRDYLKAEDVQPFFIQADFELPKAPGRVILRDAKRAGYLNGSGRGEFKLNPVGYNLVAHKLGADAVDGITKPRAVRRAKKGRAKTKR